MLCPEVWNFKTPESNFKTDKGPLNYDNCYRNINQLHYNHLISIVLPDTSRVPNNLKEALLTDCDYYKIINLSLGDLIDNNFINSFFKKGRLGGLSINRRVDCDDCACITSDGLIILLLVKKTYQALGLDGKLSHYHRNNKELYVVKVDVLKDYFKAGKRNFERTKDCLKKINFDFLVRWEPHSEEVCPSSVAKYFSDFNYDVTICSPDHEVRTSYTVKVPEFELDKADEFIEWLGAFSLGCELNEGGIDNFVTAYETPEPWKEYGQVKLLQWKGFFTTNQIEKLFQEMTKCSKIGVVPWLSLYVQGFSDAPINWGTNEHHYYVNGDNAYIIVLNAENYLLGKQMCSQKYYK